jgi:hypothetical protein
VPVPDLVDHDLVQVADGVRAAQSRAGVVQLAERLLHDVLGVVVAEQGREPDQPSGVGEEHGAEPVLLHGPPRVDAEHLHT